MTSRFVSEPLQPVAGTLSPARMAAGGPGLPAAFEWKGGTLRIARVRRTWRDTGPCDHGSDERYVRKHWFEVETEGGQVAQLYFERNPRPRTRGSRWWLFSLDD